MRDATVSQHRARGKDILVSPYYFSDNLEGLADLVAGTGSGALQSALEKIKSNQGWPVSIIQSTGEIGGYKLSTTERQLIEKLSSERIVKPPKITFGPKEESFIFTPKPGAGRLNAANREIYERAMALISAVRKGQLLPDTYRIRVPVRILESLRDNGFLRQNSEAGKQYHKLVVLRVASLRQTSPGQYQLHLNRTEENIAALNLAIKMLRTGELADMEVNQEARLALARDEVYVQSLVSATALRTRPKQLTDPTAIHDFEQLVLKLD